ncbi:GWT1-domain-containing protein [Multifurca ochricompacta]|uniref:GPI-anchored wall transfer protein n=1 Tax=Multifurca ochricompacta TaxID=376703 RepID=A0AAD4QIA5_9AGAM|nr:GWT1-domain-containing protein [Multifurca ochricompacta]
MILASHQDGDDYKTAKESFVAGMTGSTVFHINMISLVALHTFALPPPKSFQFLSEWLFLVVPLLLSMTLFADNPGTLSAVFFILTALICFYFPPHESGTPLPSGGSVSPSASPTVLRRIPSSSFHRDERDPQSAAPALEPNTIRLPALSTYRAHLMLMTVLAILAVDFPVFPRALAKCETYGVSLMDMGVGSFVFSQGIVYAIPLLKIPAYLWPPITLEMVFVLSECIPILVLGLVRAFLVKGTQYPEHITEYGVHWNFFLTLALTPVLRTYLQPLFSRMSISLLGLLVALGHQLLLSAGFASYVLNAPRETFISANKEGIVSLTGYLAIHLLGLSIGTLILPHSPSYFRRQQAAARRWHNGDEYAFTNLDTKQALSVHTHRENDRTATELFSYAVIYWMLFGISRYLHIGGPDVNLPYIMWVAAYNTTFLLCYLLLDLAFFPTPLAKSTYSPVSGLKVVRKAKDGRAKSTSTPPPSTPMTTTTTTHGPSPMPAPPLLEAINKNALAVFLLANVATGVVNLSMRTMYTPDGRAMGVLGVYAFGLCAFAWAVRDRRVWKL